MHTTNQQTHTYIHTRARHIHTHAHTRSASIARKTRRAYSSPNGTPSDSPTVHRSKATPTELPPGSPPGCRIRPLRRTLLSAGVQLTRVSAQTAFTNVCLLKMNV